ncbi:MAG TPA: RNHCP domain-containing protein [bacterium]|nr:RNHCP domain-containing protein [bacterium]HPL95549.1 RNHCP domain-containing protein [bacterium]
MANLKFKRTKENFVCELCDAKIIGTGYTDHCPNCLWSKHVDVFPGDRQANCGGLMAPQGVTLKNQKYIIHYQCQKCGQKFSVKSLPSDNVEEIIKLASH